MNNGRRYSDAVKRAVIARRKEGYSLAEISKMFGVTKDTASRWLRGIKLSAIAQKRLDRLKRDGQRAGAKSRMMTRKASEVLYFNEALEEIETNPDYAKIACAMIYWCEGKKKANGVAFTNSDPKLVRTFLKLLRASFQIDESKFHPCVHLHSYHSAEKQLDFWSKITDIDKRQFNKPYRKANSGKRKRIGYQGCINVCYGSADLSRRLIAIAKAYLQHTGV